MASNLITEGCRVSLQGTESAATKSPDALWDGNPDSCYGWMTGASSSHLEIEFAASALIDTVICRWFCTPEQYTFEVLSRNQWQAVDVVEGNRIIGPRVKLHQIAGVDASAIRLRVDSAVSEDLHGRPAPDGFDVALSGIEAFHSQDPPSHIRDFLELETPRLATSLEKLPEELQKRGEPDPAWLEAPIPEFEPIPRELYFGRETGKEVNRMQSARQQLLTRCAWAYATTGREGFAEKAWKVFDVILTHYEQNQSFRFIGIDWKAVTFQDPAYNLTSLTEAYDLIAASEAITLKDRMRFICFCLDLGEFQHIALRDRFIARENWASCSIAEMTYLVYFLKGFPEASRWEAMADSKYASCFGPFLNDGYWWECSPSHSVYMIRGLLKYALGKHLLGRPVWSEDIKGQSLGGVLEALAKTMTPFGEVPSINDSTGNDSHLLTEWPELRAALYLMGRGDLLKMMKDQGDPPFIPSVEFSPTSQEDPPYTSVLLPNAGLAVMRDGWERNEAYLIFDYGPHGGGHGHPDKMSFIMFADGQHWIPDAGNSPHYSVFEEQHTWHKQTVAHNTVLVDGESQQECTGELVFWHIDNRIDLVCAQHEGYEGLLHRRTIVHPKREYFLIHDFLQSAGKAFDLEWLLHVYGEPGDQDQGRMTFKKPGHGLLVVSDSIGENAVEIQQGLCGGLQSGERKGDGYPSKGGPGWIYVPYIGLPDLIDAKGHSAEFTVILFPFQGAQPEVILEKTVDSEDRASAVRVKFGDVEDTLVLSRPGYNADAHGEYKCWEISDSSEVVFERRSSGEVTFRQSGTS